MNSLTTVDLNRLNVLLDKIKQRTASSVEMNEFLDLVQKSGQNNWQQLGDYLRVAGYNNIDEFRTHLSEVNKQELINGLIMIGFAILVASAIAQLFNRR